MSPEVSGRINVIKADNKFGMFDRGGRKTRLLKKFISNGGFFIMNLSIFYFVTDTPVTAR